MMERKMPYVYVGACMFLYANFKDLQTLMESIKKKITVW